MIPSVWVGLDELPLNATGKLDRKALPEPAAEIIGDGLDAPLTDSTELCLQKMWGAVLGIDNIGAQSNFFELGGHSLVAVSVAAQLSHLYGTTIPVRTIFEHPTLTELAAFLRRNLAWTPPSSLIPINPGLQPFFCVHPAGGLAMCYIALARALGPQQAFYGLQSRGLDDGEPYLTRIEEMAECYLTDIRQVQSHGPYRLGGWSLGGVIAYEMAQQLAAAGEEVELLALLDAWPNLEGLDTPVTEQEIEDCERNHIIPLIIERLVDSESQNIGSVEDLLECSLPKLKTSMALPEELTVSQLRRLLRVWAANECAVKRYRCRPYTGRISLFKSPARESRAWSRLASGGLDEYELPASHADFVAESNVRLLAQKLRHAIEAIS
jgi:thioesterase domain-containing protein